MNGPGQHLKTGIGSFCFVSGHCSSFANVPQPSTVVKTDAAFSPINLTYFVTKHPERPGEEFEGQMQNMLSPTSRLPNSPVKNSVSMAMLVAFSPEPLFFHPP
jgi:hypothetical protein